MAHVQGARKLFGSNIIIGIAAPNMIEKKLENLDSGSSRIPPPNSLTRYWTTSTRQWDITFSPNGICRNNTASLHGITMQ